MRKGNIIEEGSHEELLLQKGDYYDLWKNQTVHINHIKSQSYAMWEIKMNKIYSFEQLTDSVELLERKPPRFIIWFYLGLFYCLVFLLFGLILERLIS